VVKPNGFTTVFVMGRANTFGENNLTRIKKVSGPGGCSLKAPGRSRAAPWSRPQARNPQPPDLMHKDRTKNTNQRQPSGILNQKALAHCFMGFATLWSRNLIGMNPIQGFSSASSGPQAGLPHNQSR